MNNNTNNTANKEGWDFGVGAVCTWGNDVYTVNFLPSIEYIHNNYNRGISITLFGLGVFIGKVNSSACGYPEE